MDKLSHEKTKAEIEHEYIDTMLDLIKHAAIAGDDEKAHSLEKDLWASMLMSIAVYCKDDHYKELTKKTIASRHINFCRWFA